MEALAANSRLRDACPAAMPHAPCSRLRRRPPLNAARSAAACSLLPALACRCAMRRHALARPAAVTFLPRRRIWAGGVGWGERWGDVEAAGGTERRDFPCMAVQLPQMGSQPSAQPL